MSGHSKWSQIKRKKAVTDAGRGNLFTKLIREITAAARNGGGDPEGNPRLRTAVQTARNANMPNDNIDRAVQKGVGNSADVNYEEIVYEGYGPCGVAVLALCLTENRNRTANDVRFTFGKYNGNLGGAGAVAWKFDIRGLITVERAGVDEETLLGVALDAGALDVDTGDPESYVVVTQVPSLESVRLALAEHGIPVAGSEIARVPQILVALEASEATKVLKLVDALEELDDVQKVWTDADIPDEVLSRMSG